MLGSIHPIARSLIAAYYPLEIRGQYYGSLELGAGIGGVLGAVRYVSDPDLKQDPLF